MIPEAVSVERRGCELFELMCAHDLEGIVAKRLVDPYGPRTRWLRIKNRGQRPGRIVQPGPIADIAENPLLATSPGIAGAAHRTFTAPVVAEVA